MILSRDPRIGRLLNAACVAVMAFLSVRYLAINVQALSNTRRDLAAHRELIQIVNVYDTLLRDLPKAFEVRYDSFFGDPQFPHKAYWYPFVNPAIAAFVQWMVRWEMHASYVLTALLFAALGWFGLGALVVRIAGPLAFAAFLATTAGPSFGVNPARTSSLGCVLALWAVHELFLAHARSSEASGGRFSQGLFVAGFAVGLLGLWHGASFVCFALVSLLLIAGLSLQRAAAADARQDALARTARNLGIWGSGVLVPMSLLVVPQLVMNGSLCRNDEARLYLSPAFNGGNDPAGFLSWAQLPTGFGLISLLAVAAVVVVGRRWLRGPDENTVTFLLLGWLLCLVETKLGFIEHVKSPAIVGAIASRLILVPPHTWQLLADAWILPVAFALSAGMVATRLVGQLRARLVIPLTAVAIAGSALTAMAHVTAPIQFEHSGSFAAVPSTFVAFAGHVSAITHRSGVLFGGSLSAVGLVRPCSPISRSHSNDALYDWSSGLQASMIDAAMAGDGSRYASARHDLDCDYVLAYSGAPRREREFVSRCADGSPLASNGSTLQLFKLAESCR